MSTWQAGYYYQHGEEIVWKSLTSKTLQAAMESADQWVNSIDKGALPWSMVFVAKEDSETVTALRYLDEDEWMLSGKGIVAGIKHRMIR